MDQRGMMVGESCTGSGHYMTEKEHSEATRQVPSRATIDIRRCLQACRVEGGSAG